MGRRPKKRPLQMSKFMWISLVVMAVFIGELLFYTWCRVQCTQVGYEIRNLEYRHQKLDAIKSNFKIELARLGSPDRLAKKAREELGLVMPAPSQVVTMP